MRTLIQHNSSHEKRLKNIRVALTHFSPILHLEPLFRGYRNGTLSKNGLDEMYCNCTEPFHCDMLFKILHSTLLEFKTVLLGYMSSD